MPRIMNLVANFLSSRARRANQEFNRHLEERQNQRRADPSYHGLLRRGRGLLDFREAMRETLDLEARDGGAALSRAMTQSIDADRAYNNFVTQHHLDEGEIENLHPQQMQMIQNPAPPHQAAAPLRNLPPVGHEMEIEDLSDSEEAPLATPRGERRRPIDLHLEDDEDNPPPPPPPRGGPGGGGQPPPGYIPEEDDPIPRRGRAHRLMQQGIGHAKEIKGDLSAMKGMGDVVKHGAEVGSGISKLASKDGKGSTAGNIIGGAIGGLVAGLGTYAAYRALSTPEQRSALRAENNFHDEADLQDRRRRMNQEAQDAIVRV